MSTFLPGFFHPREHLHLRMPPPICNRRQRRNAISGDEELARLNLNEEMVRLDAPHGEDARDPRHQRGETNYINMLLQLDHIPQIYSIFAGLFTWILLAGYLVLPATFTSLQNSRILKTYQNLPLLWMAAIFCAIGASGMGWLWWMWKMNYVWILNRIIL